MADRRIVVALAALASLCVGVERAWPQGISSGEASQYVGERQVVEGNVTDVRREGKVVRLAFSPDPKGFTVALIFGLLRDVPPDIEHVYAGRTIRVEGKIRSFHGAPEMLIQDLSVIEFVDTMPTPTPVIPPDEGVELRDEMRRIESRLDHLELEVQQLRHGK